MEGQITYMRISVKFYFCLIFLNTFVFWSNPAAADSPDSLWSEYGIPIYRNYSPTEYRAHFQNWAVIQDQQGVILVANNDGLLSYDGENWRRYDLEGKLFHSLRSLGIDASGTIYCGTGSHFGYLERREDGNFRFVSLMDRVKEGFRNFNDVWYTLILNDAVFFITHTSIFRWKNNRMEILESTDSQHIFHTAFVVRDKLFIRQSGVGLLQLDGERLGLVAGGRQFAEIPVYFMQLHGETSILVGTDRSGFYLTDGTQLTTFMSSTEPYLKQHHLYCGTVLRDGNYALGTRTGGLLIMDPDGNLLKIFDNSHGLQDNSVWYVYNDHQNNLWLALNNGITRVEMPSPVSVFNKLNGLQGTVESIVRHNGVLFVATNLGVFYLADQPRGYQGDLPVFRRIEGLNEYVWNLLSHENDLLAGTTGGIYLLGQKSVTKLSGPWGSVFEIQPSRYHPGLFFLACRDGVGLLKQVENRWTDLGFLGGVEEKVYHVAEADSTTLWLETASEGIIRIKLRNNPVIQKEEVTFYDSKNGLSPERIYPLMVGEDIYFAAPDGMYKFNPAKNNFGKTDKFNLKPVWGFLGREDRFGRLWISRYENFGDPERIFVGSESVDGSYRWDSGSFSGIPDISHVNAIYPESREVIWFGTSEGLVKYDARFATNEEPVLNILLRRIIVNQDSIIFNGGMQKTVPQFSYRENNLRFEFALTSFEQEERNQYSTFLDGFEQNWSPWNLENRRDFTNITPGKYIFRVRGRNSSGVESPESSFSFSILPPWYRTTWAYLFYGFLLIIGIVAVDRYQRRRFIKIEQQKARLREAEIIREKNIELNEKNVQLENALDELKKAKVQLQSSESRFRSVVQTANEAIITADKGGQIVFWNQHAEKLFGYSQKQALGQPLTILMPERYRKAHLAGIERFMTRGETRMMGKITELHAVRKNGSEFPIELTIAEWTTDEGEFVTGIIRDISKRKQEQVAKEKAHALLEEEHRRKSLELQKACDLQHSMLPRELPRTGYLEIGAYMKTAIEVGGDYYDFHLNGEDDLTVIIGDATGHGLEAGMMVAATKSLFSSLVWERDLIQIFDQANLVFKNLNLKNMYMALQMVRVRKYHLEVSSAGMPPVLIYRSRQKKVEEITIKALPLGFSGDVTFGIEKTELEPGDTVMLMSDGFPERFDPHNEIIGFEKTAQIFGEVADNNPDVIIDHFVKTGDTWAGGRAQNDDITFVVLKIK